MRRVSRSFRERMAKTEMDKIVWKELQRQLDAKGLKVKTERFKMLHSLKRILDCQKNHVATKLKLVAVEIVPGQRKETKPILAYKLHQKTDIDYGLMREIEATTASLHDSQVNLSVENELVSK